MKKYLLYTLKRYIPLFVVAFALCFFTFITVFGGLPTEIKTMSYLDADAEMYYTYGNLSSISVNSGVIFLLILVAIFTIILPFFANSYRYSLQSADTFYQIGKNKKSIRWMNNLVLLVMFILVFTAAFIFGVAILFFRQLPNIGRPDEVVTYGETQEITHFLFYNFGLYVPVYLLIVVFAVLNYAVSYLFITRANNLVDSIILLLFGEFLLGIGVMTPFWFLLVCSAAGGGWEPIVDETILLGTRTAGFVSPIAFILYLFEGLITGNGSQLVTQLTETTYDYKAVLGVALSFISLAIFLFLGGLGIYSFLKEKESSGELAGKPVGRDKWQEIIFHTGAGMVGLWICSLQSITGLVSTLVVNKVFSYILLISEVGFYAAAYYVLYGLLRRNFKLTKKDLLIMLPIVITNLVIGLSLLTASTINNISTF